MPCDTQAKKTSRNSMMNHHSGAMQPSMRRCATQSRPTRKHVSQRFAHVKNGSRKTTTRTTWKPVYIGTIACDQDSL